MASVSVQEHVYSAARGAYITDKDAQVVGPILDRMAEDGRCTPHEIVAAARAEDSPLHRYFTWDQSQAAYNHNLWEARKLAKSYRVEIVTIQNNQPTQYLVPGLVSIQPDRSKPAERTYIPIGQALADGEIRQQVIGDAWHRLRYWGTLFDAYRGTPGFESLEPVFRVLHDDTSE